jgi:hypothetical protein
MMLALVAALVPLAFAPPLFDPFLETKELLLVTGAAAAAALWLIAGRALEIPRTPVWLAIGAIAIAATFSNARGPAAVHFAALLVLLAVAASEMHEPAARAALAGCHSGRRGGSPLRAFAKPGMGSAVFERAARRQVARLRHAGQPELGGRISCRRAADRVGGASSPAARREGGGSRSTSSASL